VQISYEARELRPDQRVFTSALCFQYVFRPGSQDIDRNVLTARLTDTRLQQREPDASWWVVTTVADLITGTRVYPSKGTASRFSGGGS
jgi:hypothetical protein